MKYQLRTVSILLNAQAQRDFSQVEIKATDLGNGVHVLHGAGGTKYCIASGNVFDIESGS